MTFRFALRTAPIPVIVGSGGGIVRWTGTDLILVRRYTTTGQQSFAQLPRLAVSSNPEIAATDPTLLDDANLPVEGTVLYAVPLADRGADIGLLRILDYSLPAGPTRTTA